MNEVEWLACTDPEQMLAFVGGKASDQVRRLFACACCRRVWHLLADERSRQAVEVAERFARGHATLEELAAVRHQADQAQADARHAEWSAEADANFCCTADYCAVRARQCAACAARAAAFIAVAEPDGGWKHFYWGELHPRKRCEGSHTWAAWAVKEAKRSAVYAARQIEKPGLHDLADSAGIAAGATEAAEQAKLLRSLVGNPCWISHADPRCDCSAFTPGA
jgi:hypothetical protein